MEKCVGIVSEFNPFHNGHAYLIRRVRERYPQKGIVCVMSGNFVQRGSFAVQEKYSRAACAVAAGADLVLELTAPFSCLSAEAFAGSAVHILSSTGLVDTLAFGCEEADEKTLRLVAERLSSPEFEESLALFLSTHKGVGYPAAREEVYTALYGKESLLSLPNAALALEYLLAMKKSGASFSLFPVKRADRGYHSTEAEGEFASATAVRKALRENLPLSSMVSEFTLAEMERERAEGRFPVWDEAMAPILFYLLKVKSAKKLSECYGLAPLAERARREAAFAVSVEDLVCRMKTAHLTDSRIRRSLLALLLNTPRHAEKEKPAYTVLLAASEKGREWLSQREEDAFPLFTKPAHALRSKDKTVLRQASFSALADEIYASAFPAKQDGGYFMKKMPRLF